MVLEILLDQNDEYNYCSSLCGDNPKAPLLQHTLFVYALSTITKNKINLK